MLNCKTICICTAVMLWLHGCKPASKSFSYKDNIDKDFFSETMRLAGLENVKADSIKVFKAEMEEKLVEMDNIPEYRLINKKSDQQPVKLADVKNRQLLYLFQLFPDSGTDTVFVYLATGFSENTCTGLGPVYLGMQRKDRIQFKDVLNIVQLKMRDQPQAIKDKAAAGETVRRYHINEKKESTHLIFINEQRFPASTDRTTPVLIKQIILNQPNKIGGKKAVLFTTDKIFNDPKALVFVYDSTIQ